MTDPSTYHLARPVRILGGTVVLAGLLLPIALAGLAGAATQDQWLVTAVLAAAALFMSNLSLELKIGISLAPVGAPLVMAAVLCTPAQAATVAILGFVAEVSLWRERGPRPNLISAGLASITIATISSAAHLLHATFATPALALASGVLGAAGYLVLDALVYMAWEHCESRSARVVWEYSRTSLPLDVGITATAVLVAAPFHGQPPLLGGMLLAFTGCVTWVYRLTASEHMHRTRSERLKDMFSRYVPASIADQLSDSTDQVKLGGETRTVSVLFADIRGFTAWSEQHPAETVVQQLNQLLGALTDAVMSCEGTLDKFTGDGLMAFWGAPLEQPDHAHRACRAAERIHEALAACNALRASEGMPPFQVGVGIATGQAVVGNIGHEQRLDYTAIGDTVNLAARLESATKDLGCDTVISQATAAMLGNRAAFGFRAMSDIRVKGKSQPVQVFGRSGGAAPRSGGEVTQLSLESEQQQAIDRPRGVDVDDDGAAGSQLAA